MSALRDYIARLQTITVFSQEEQIFKILKANEHTVIDLNLSQLSHGRDSQGNSIEPPYLETTKEIKKFKGQPTDRVTLKDEGNFCEGFFIDGTEFPVGIWSEDEKTIPLTQKYGGEIFGLTKESQAALQPDILPQILDYYRKILLL